MTCSPLTLNFQGILNATDRTLATPYCNLRGAPKSASSLWRCYLVGDQTASALALPVSLLPPLSLSFERLTQASQYHRLIREQGSQQPSGNEPSYLRNSKTSKSPPKQQSMSKEVDITRSPTHHHTLSYAGKLPSVNSVCFCFPFPFFPFFPAPPSSTSPSTLTPSTPTLEDPPSPLPLPVQAETGGAPLPRIFLSDTFPLTFGFSLAALDDGNSGNKELSNFGGFGWFFETRVAGTLRGSIARGDAAAPALADQAVVCFC